MKSRRGMALLAALWLIVAIAAVALQFSLVARERRTIGLQAADRGRHRTLAAGALASMHARMEYELRNGPQGAAAATAMSAADPWFDAGSIYTGSITVGEDSMPIDVVAHDLGTTININFAPENELRTLFGFVLESGTTSDKLAQAIMDWRDVDDNPRPNGGERELYLQEGLLVLPTNGPFREVDDLIHLYGMTPETLELLRPYITTRGESQSRTNLNAAPEPVLRALPGMSDPVLNQILSLRSQGRRITSVDQVMTAVTRGLGGGGGGGRGGQNPQQQQVQRITQQLTQRTIVNTTDIELTFYVRDPLRLQPTRMIAIVSRGNNNQASVTWQLW